MLRRGSTDGRSAEGRLLAVSRAELVACLGGLDRCSAAQLLLVDRIGMLRLRLHQLDERMVRDGDLSPADTKAYLAWSNTLTRSIRQLSPGLKAAPHRPLTHADFIAQFATPATVSAR